MTTRRKSRARSKKRPRGTRKAQPSPPSPPTYDRPAILAVVFEEMAQGTSLREVCRTHEDFPAPSTVLLWLSEDPLAAEQYARARAERADYWFDRMYTVALEARQAVQEESEDSRRTSAVVAAYKLEVDALKWQLARMDPKRYGDRVDVTSGGEKVAGVTLELFGKEVRL